MCSALEEFLRVMAEDRSLKKQEENVDPPSTLVVADVPECQSMSPTCYKRTSTMQHHSMPSKTNLLSRASQEIAIHFSCWHVLYTCAIYVYVMNQCCAVTPSKLIKNKLWSNGLDAPSSMPRNFIVVGSFWCDHDVKGGGESLKCKWTWLLFSSPHLFLRKLVKYHHLWEVKTGWCDAAFDNLQFIILSFIFHSLNNSAGVTLICYLFQCLCSPWNSSLSNL